MATSFEPVRSAKIATLTDASAPEPEIKNGLPRGVDAVVSLMGLALSLPLLLLSGLAVALTSPGGVLFRQQRVGCCGKLFTLYKLRTMRPSTNGPQVTAADDQRITRVGGLLRKTKLDELPTLWNVLRGDMALVGPRPEVPNYVDLENPQWQRVLKSRPGITDPVTLRLRNEQELLAQVEGDVERYYLNELLPLKLDGYLAYFAVRTWSSDLRILLQTVAAVIVSSKVRPPGDKR